MKFIAFGMNHRISGKYQLENSPDEKHAIIEIQPNSLDFGGLIEDKIRFGLYRTY